ncbi:MAG: hypothetical protein A2X23_02875 [Chloroflexi bacterium GWC2_73_18]|nr:MAG: hypothetical protein A2X23_02875 [Chloroflexi bacterium GWC2_73_18]
MALPSSVSERLARLAPDQRAAATAPPGPVLCIAPAGSGKTTTLVARIAWLVGGPLGADPATVCAVTFNRRAAEELDARLRAALAPLGVGPGTVRVRTFHALGREILASSGADLSRLVDRAVLLRELFPRAAPAERQRLDDAFARLKLDLGLDAATVAAEAEAAVARGEPPPGPVARAFLAYEAALAERDALDFDDLVGRALALLRRDAGVLATWCGRCAHLLVDEVQDVDRAQLDLAVLLAGPERRIFLVGDDDQTIYAWRLADVRRVLGLAGSLPGLWRVALTTNYRCPAPVVRRAVRLIERNGERFAKAIRPREGATGSLRLAALATDDVTRARALLAGWPAEPGSAAVLARTNRELVPFAAIALERGLPFAAESHGLLLEDAEVDRLLDGAACASGAEAPPLLALGRLEDGARGRATRRRVLAALLAWAAPYPTLGALRAAIEEARRRLPSLHRPDAALTLATIHGTKGLEFDDVAVAGLDDGRFPNRRTLDEAAEPERALEEERRLAYVAWTRARRSLVLLYDPGAPSLFLREAFAPGELAPAAGSA